MTRLDHLVKMTNQIALNLSANGNEEAVAVEVAAHLEKFWAPSMKNLMLDASSDKDIGLNPISQRAVQHLTEMRKVKQSS